MYDRVFFCDTYALIEIIGGNSKYKNYLNEVLITSDYNLMELYYAFLRDYSKQIAERNFDFWSAFVVQIPHGIIKDAMTFKLMNRREKLSYVDCIGYVFSLTNGISFLTGDSKFEGRMGVEFVK